MLRKACLLVVLSTLALVLLGSSDLRAREGEQTPQAIGFLNLEGGTGLVEFTGQAEGRRSCDAHCMDALEGSFGAPV